MSYSIGGNPEEVISIDMCQRHSARVIGRKFFHSRCISWSYRNRGYEARIHRNPADNSITFDVSNKENSSEVMSMWAGLRNRIVVRVFIIKMLVYSAKKNKANGPAEYSTLNPDTSSDSPSVRSNGARFVSASVEIYHIIIRGQDENIRYIGSCVTMNVCILNPPENKINESSIIPRVTSYEMVWATARKAPIRAYLEFEAQPDHKIE